MSVSLTSKHDVRAPSDAPGTPPGAGRISPLTILFLTVFLDLVGFGIVIPLLPLYAERFGATPVAVTLLVAIFSLMQFAFAPWWGQLSDRIGRRPVLLVGLFGSAISYLLFGLAGSLAMLFFARALAGMMGANVGVAQAYVADVTPPEERARGMGLIGAAFGLGFIFGPALGGVLSHFGHAAPFLGAGLLAAVNGVLALRFLPEPARHARAQAPQQLGLGARLRALVAVGGGSRERVLYATFFLLTFAFAGFEATLSLWADRRWAFSPAEVAYLFAYIGVVVTVVQGGMIGPLTRWIGERRLAFVGIGALAVGLGSLPAAPSALTLAVPLAVLAFGQGASVAAISALISRAAAPSEQGRLLGMSQSLSALGRVLGPVWGGVAFARLGISAPYLSGAAIVAGALVLMLLMYTRTPEAA